jgi:hypothetical protein
MNRKKSITLIITAGVAFLLLGGQILAAGMGRGRGRGAIAQAGQGRALQQNLNNQIQGGQTPDAQTIQTPTPGRGQGQGLRRGQAAGTRPAQNPGQQQWRQGWTQGFMRGFAAGRQSVLNELQRPARGQGVQQRLRQRLGAQQRQGQVPADGAAAATAPRPGQGLRRGQAGVPANAGPGQRRGQGRGLRRGRAGALIDTQEPIPVPEN